jgi:hypothetical protein
MSDFLTLLERDLVQAAARRAPAARMRRPPVRTLLLAAALVVVVATSAAAAALTVLRGSPLPGPSEKVAGRQATPVPGSSRVEPMRARDPGGGPPWALRIARSKTGLVCSTVGQVVDGSFGIVGLDGHFRALPATAVDGCGRVRPNATSLIGARVFDAPRRADVRTVVNGYAGPELRAVSVEAGGSRRTPPVGPGGTFILAVRSYPEDIGIRVELRFADGHVERHVFGASAFVSRDPLGAGAWRANGFEVDRYRGTCVSFHPARPLRDLSSSPAACGVLREDRRYPRGYFFAVRRLVRTSGAGYTFRHGHWVAPPRTAVWGGAGEDVERIVVTGPHVRREVIATNAFVAVFPARIDPLKLRVEVTLKDGSVRVEQGDTNLRPPPPERG